VSVPGLPDVAEDKDQLLGNQPASDSHTPGMNNSFLGRQSFAPGPSIYLKFFRDPRAAIGLIAFFEDIHDLNQQLFILLPSGRWSAAKPFVITGSTHIKYFAHHLNGKTGTVIAHKLVDFPSLLEKMLTAFF
jgi:hypothetical protein